MKTITNFIHHIISLLRHIAFNTICITEFKIFCRNIGIIVFIIEHLRIECS